MLNNDHRYYLKRALFHRRRVQLATCPEARLCHMQLLKAYQLRLTDIRAVRMARAQAPAVPPTRGPFFNLSGAVVDLEKAC